jgi:predicted PurR-regulated permease PerM
LRRFQHLYVAQPGPFAAFERRRDGATIDVMIDAGPPKLQIPRWIQLIGLPLLLLLGWIVATAAAHVVFVFVVAALLALLLNPIVRAVARVRVPRGLAVAIVYLSFAGALAVTVGALATVVVGQTKTAADRVDAYFTKPAGQGQVPADRDVDRFQRWLNQHHLRQLDVQQRGHRAVERIREKDVGGYTTRVVDFVEGAAISVGKALFALVLLIVVSIYMLLDLPRLQSGIDRRFPPRPGSGALIPRIEAALAGYVRGQALLSLIIGGSAGIGLWIFGVTGVLPGADRWALLFGAWVAVTEVVPYIGPWLGAIPPTIFAIVDHPISALWVVLLFLGIHQLEGHVVAPNVLGNALRLHPLLVIFGLLAGGEIYGLAGALLALPLLAAGRAIWEFATERVTLEDWRGGTVPVEVEVEPPAEVKPLKPTASP